MRERLERNEEDIKTLRITPARAGKTRQPLASCQRFEDHPRSCGKDVIALNILRVAAGSPPLVRERRYGRSSCRRLVGITPARAGKTAQYRSPRASRRDHPRSCGKDTSTWSKRGQHIGSPPLVRERPNHDG